MINVCYAHNPEVRELKRLVDETDWRERVSWRRYADQSPTSAPATLMVNVGFAGALTDQFALGEIVLVSQHDQPEPARRFAAATGLLVARCHTSGTPILDQSEAAALHGKTGADIVDMELSKFHRIALDKNVSLVAFKLISDRCAPESRRTIEKNLDNWSKKLGETVFDFLTQL